MAGEVVVFMFIASFAEGTFVAERVIFLISALLVH
jgi:hypothetical protein